MGRSPAEKANGVLAWVGAMRGGVELPDGTVVVSPHLDDAVFSLGAAIARATRRGRAVTVLTVLSGDPESDAPAGKWDRDAGFATAGEAAVARRVEDAEACAILGAKPVWLPFGDHQYERNANEKEVRVAVAEAVEGAALVLMPGFPLMHEDHKWLADALVGTGYARYVEQPYAALWHEGPPGDEWHRAQASLRDRRAKARAWKAYGSQLEALGENAERRTVRYEASRGGEAIAW